MKQAHGPDDNRSMWMLMGIGIVCVFGSFIQILVLSRYLDRPLALVYGVPERDCPRGYRGTYNEIW